MTVPATARRAGPFTGNGITLTFPFAFKVFSAADVQVDLSNATGTAWTGTLNSDYTVTLNADQATTPGGSVSYAVAGIAAALPSGYKLAATGKRAYAQTVTLPTGGSYQARSVEDALDSLQMQVQQVQNEVDRSLTLGPLTPAGVGTEIPQPEANKFLGWNATGDKLQNIDPATAASIVAYATTRADQFTGNGAQTTFTLTANPGALNNLRVAVGGVVQAPTSDYTWASGTTLTFLSAPPVGAPVLVQYQQALPQGTADSGTTSYQPPGTAVSTTAQAALRRVVWLDDYILAGESDYTAAITRAVSATSRLGGSGTVLLQSGKVYNSQAVAFTGAIGVMFKGQNGGSVGNLSAGSPGGAAVLNFTNATGTCMTFTADTYNTALYSFEDVAIYGNTPDFVMRFQGNSSTLKQASQIYFNRVSLTNAGGTDNGSGNGILFSASYYVYADKLFVWKTGTLYSVGNGIVINKGAFSSYLGGLFNFTNCSLYGWYNGMLAGNATPGVATNEHYASINFVNSELNSNGTGIQLLYGVEVANVSGCYVEGNLQRGLGVYNKARNVTIEKNFFNNSTASVADVELGQSGSGTSYQQFYNVEVKNNQFLGVNTAGVKISANVGATANIEGNLMTLATTGAVGVTTAESSVGVSHITAKNNHLYGFAAGNAMQGRFTERLDTNEYNSGGTLTARSDREAVVYSAFVDFTQIAPWDPETTVLTNTTVSARYINAAVATSKNRRQFITLTPSSTQSVRLMASNATIQLGLLAPGKSAILSNDGTNEYVTLLP